MNDHYTLPIFNYATSDVLWQSKTLFVWYDRSSWRLMELQWIVGVSSVIKAVLYNTITMSKYIRWRKNVSYWSSSVPVSWSDTLFTESLKGQKCVRERWPAPGYRNSLHKTEPQYSMVLCFYYKRESNITGTVASVESGCVSLKLKV